MSVDLTEVMERARTPHMGLDPESVLLGGRRRRLRLRRRLASAGVTLAVVAAGLAATLTVADRTDPTPAATVLTANTVTAPLHTDLWSFDLVSGRIQFGRVVQGTKRVVPLGSVPVVNGQAWFVPKDRPNVVLGVAPAGRLRAEDVVAGGFLGGAYGYSGEQLKGGLEVYARHFEDPLAAARFRGQVFTDAQGRLHGPGGLLPSASFGHGSATSSLTLWLDASTRTYGQLRDESISAHGLTSPSEVTANREAVFRATSSGTVSTPATRTVVAGAVGPEEGWISGVAPTGTTNLRVQFSPDTTVITPLGTKRLGADHVAFAVEYRGAKGKNVMVTVSWQNPDGTQGSRILD